MRPCRRASRSARTTPAGSASRSSLDIYVPKASAEEAHAVAEKAHTLCPYSNATRGNIPVELNIVD